MGINGNFDNTLLEKKEHGTRTRPIEGIQFRIGPDYDPDNTLYPSYFSVDTHWHPEIEILYIRDGVFHAELDLESLKLKSGDICFVDSGTLHMLKSLLPSSDHLVLLFDPGCLQFSSQDDFQSLLLTPLRDRSLTLPKVIHPEDRCYAMLQKQLLEIIQLSLEKPDDWYFPAKLRLLELLCGIYREKLLVTADTTLSYAARRKIDRFKVVSAYIEEHLSEPLELEQLASIAEINSQYLCRSFKEVSGQTPIQYLISRRIEQAARLLQFTDRSILEIGLECGFDNFSYFIRKFRSLKGCTPGEYRRRTTGDGPNYTRSGTLA